MRTLSALLLSLTVTLALGALTRAAEAADADAASEGLPSAAAPTLTPTPAPIAAGFRVSHFIVEGDNPLSDADTTAVLSTHLGMQAGLNDLVAAARDLEEVLRADGHLFHHVYLPPQTISNETVLLRVQQLRIADVTVTGNLFYSTANVLHAVPQLQPGTPPEIGPLKRALSLANDNPARHITLNLKEGRDPGSVEAELNVRDRKPWSVFANLSNVGSDSSGRTRLAVGAQHANLLGYDDALTLTYTTSPEAWRRVQQYGVNYRVPLYLTGGVLAFVYARSDIDSGTIQDVFNVSGAGEFAGISYTQQLPQDGGLRQQLTLALDDRAFTNDVSFLGNPIGTDVRSRPATLRYNAEYRGTALHAGFGISYVHNLTGGSHNTPDVYQQVRSGAARDWDLWRYNAYLNVALPAAMQLRLQLEGQYAHDPLIPGEQFGLGGSISVRGLEERALTGDSGQRVSLEIAAPPITEGLDLYAFFDAGRIKRENAQAGEVQQDIVSSAGVGARWQWRDNLALSLEYGSAVQDASLADAGQNKLHLNLFVRY